MRFNKRIKHAFQINDMNTLCFGGGTKSLSPMCRILNIVTPAPSCGRIHKMTLCHLSILKLYIHYAQSITPPYTDISQFTKSLCWVCYQLYANSRKNPRFQDVIYVSVISLVWCFFLHHRNNSKHRSWQNSRFNPRPISSHSLSLCFSKHLCYSSCKPQRQCSYVEKQAPWFENDQWDPRRATFSYYRSHDCVHWYNIGFEQTQFIIRLLIVKCICGHKVALKDLGKQMQPLRRRRVKQQRSD